MILKFINRDEELQFLEERYNGKGFEFFVIYGRRRVGKTELIKEFIKTRPHIYFLSDKSGTINNITRFKRKISEYFNEPIIATEDLEEIFHYIANKTQKKLVLVFDEFSYLVEKDDAVPSIFQRAIDEALAKKDVMLILCGSSVSMMEKGALSRKSPLYGRKTAHLKLDEMKFKHTRSFFPLNDLIKNIEYFSILGGVPFYLEKFTDNKTTMENIKEQILSKKGKLYEEIEFILKEELREPAVYKAILTAIASGNTRLVRISNNTRIKAHDLDKYLKVLMKLGFVKKEHPVTQARSKKTIYRLDDNFFRFWFTFCEQRKTDLEIGELNLIEKEIQNRFNTFVGMQFEDLVRSNLYTLLNLDLPEVGRWWGYYRDKETNKRKEMEIDILALNKENKNILFAECKWKDKVNAKKIMKKLTEKIRHVDWHNETREEHFAIFAKSFSKKINNWEGKKVYCFDLNKIKPLIIS